MIPLRRLQQAAFAGAETSNRAGGSGGGSGLAQGAVQLGVSGSVGNQNFSSTTPASVTGTVVNFQINHPCTIEAKGFLTGKVTAGTNNGQFQIALTGPSSYSNSSGTVYNGLASFATLYCYIRATLVIPGLYTAVFQAFIDVAPTTFNVPGNSTVLEVVGYGA